MRTHVDIHTMRVRGILDDCTHSGWASVASSGYNVHVCFIILSPDRHDVHTDQSKYPMIAASYNDILAPRLQSLWWNRWCRMLTVTLRTQYNHSLMNSSGDEGGWWWVVGDEGGWWWGLRWWGLLVMNEDQRCTGISWQHRMITCPGRPLSCTHLNIYKNTQGPFSSR